jgi:hypothetical protein
MGSCDVLAGCVIVVPSLLPVWSLSSEGPYPDVRHRGSVCPADASGHRHAVHWLSSISWHSPTLSSSCACSPACSLAPLALSPPLRLARRCFPLSPPAPWVNEEKWSIKSLKKNRTVVMHESFLDPKLSHFSQSVFELNQLR